MFPTSSIRSRLTPGLVVAAAASMLLAATIVLVGNVTPAHANITSCPGVTVDAGGSNTVTVSGIHSQLVIINATASGVSVSPGQWSGSADVAWSQTLTVSASINATSNGSVTISEIDDGGTVDSCTLTVTVNPTTTTTTSTTTTTTTTTRPPTTTTTTRPPTTTTSTTTTTTTIPETTTTVLETTTTSSTTTTAAPTTTSTAAPTTAPPTTVAATSTTEAIIAAPTGGSGGSGFPTAWILGGGGGLLALLAGVFAFRQFRPALSPAGASSGALAAARKRDTKDRRKSGRPASPSPAAAPKAATAATAVVAETTAAAVAVDTDVASDADVEFGPPTMRIEREAEPSVVVPPAPPNKVKRPKAKQPKVKAPKSGPSMKQRAALRTEAKKPKAPRRPTARQRVHHSSFGRKFRRSALGESYAAWSESRRVRSKIKNRRGSAAKGRRPGR